MTATDWVQAIAMVVLVGVTIFYAWQAKKARDSAEASAQASKRMAEEMRNTRYDAFRPIIDIVEMKIEPVELAKQAYGAREGKFPELPCILRNIGVGPAIGVSSFIIVPSNAMRRSWDFGTIAVREATSEMRLSLEQTGDRMVLIAYYKDVYGRDFESRREVTLDKERSGWKIHPLETEARKIAKEEHSSD